MAEMDERLDELRIERPEGGGRRLPGWLPILAALVVLGGLAAWWLTRSGAPAVRVATAARVDAGGGGETVLNATGYVTARREATVSSKVTGRIVEVMVEEGMVVDEGEVLARLDLSNTEVSLRLAEARHRAALAALEETRVLLAEAELDLGRARRLLEDEVLSRADVDRALAERDSRAARLERQRDEAEVAEREVAYWRQEVEDRIIRAPFAGVVVSKDAQPGEMISPVSAGGGFTRTGICTIVDMESLEIEVDVNEAYINRVTPGQPVEAVLDAYPDWEIDARVIAIVPTADRQRATVRVRVGFEELDPRILPDMGVKVAFRGDAAGAGEAGVARVTIPSGALHSDGERDIVWVVADGRVERRAVSVDAVRDAEVLLSAGLRPGERVVLEAPETLADGDRVETERNEGESAG